ncbi:MAG TPA: histidine kinase dimerization/phosphoacceptor domain -containing protein [Bauldia sp.]|nr:histidine kinase dimerization/phosphoacceptor domain -containing protein [Bauldia sp.]
MPAASDHERLVAALRASRVGTWRWSIRDDVVEWDEALCEVYGIDPSAAPHSSGAFLEIIHPDDRENVWNVIRACVEEGIDADHQFRVRVGDRVRWIYDRSGLVRDADGEPLYMLGSCLDVTEQRRIQEERDAALAKQTLLLSELSHRVKNHLAMIVALLRLKGSRQTDPAAREDFDRAIERVNTIAYLHDHLYRSDNVEAVDLEVYLSDIAENLRESILVDKAIEVRLELQPFTIHVEQAVPVGLIVNELITNATKYAFAPGESGRIVVRLSIRGDRVALTVSDNGRGKPADAQTGVGTRLVRSLAAQIGARMRIVSRRGLTASLSFTARRP